jgi:hypothetical protein
MALPGRKPKLESQRRNKHDPRIGARFFPDVPNPNPRPLPPVSRLSAAAPFKRWPAATREWWKAVAALPHTVAWTDADWSAAYECALLHAKFWHGADKLAPELRRRTHELGTTWQGRLDLRICYLDEEGTEVRQDRPSDPAVTAMADYRKAVE